MQTHPRRLDRTQIHALDLRARELVADADGPDARSAAGVEHAPGEVGGQRREEEPVAQERRGHGVGHVEAVLLALVVGQDVRAVLVGVVAAAVLRGVVCHARRDGRGEGGELGVDGAAGGVGVGGGAVLWGLVVLLAGRGGGDGGGVGCDLPRGQRRRLGLLLGPPWMERLRTIV